VVTANEPSNLINDSIDGLSELVYFFRAKLMVKKLSVRNKPQACITPMVGAPKGMMNHRHIKVNIKALYKATGIDSINRPHDASNFSIFIS